MYVCLCKGITDKQIQRSVYNGASSFREVSRELGVATQCGKCGILAKQIVRETLAEEKANTGATPLFYPATA